MRTGTIALKGMLTNLLCPVGITAAYVVGVNLTERRRSELQIVSLTNCGRGVGGTCDCRANTK
jgi:hypothetical protein